MPNFDFSYLEQLIVALVLTSMTVLIHGLRMKCVAIWDIFYWLRGVIPDLPL
jgi:hypothetical protein